MEGDVVRSCAILPAEGWSLGEGAMVQEDRWKEIRRLHEEGVAIAEIARRLELDRKTVRRCLRQERWQPYSRPVRTDTLLAEHAEYLKGRAPQVRYSAQVLFQELRRRGYRGGYDTVHRFVQPLRAAEILADRAAVRFETPPGRQSQIDWGTARVPFRHQTVVLHLSPWALAAGASWSRARTSSCRTSWTLTSPAPDAVPVQHASFHQRTSGGHKGSERSRISRLWGPMRHFSGTFWGQNRASHGGSQSGPSPEP